MEVSWPWLITLLQESSWWTRGPSCSPWWTGNVRTFKTSYNHLPRNVKFYVRQFCTFMREIDQRTWLQKKEKLPAVPHGRPIKAWRLIFLAAFANRTRDGRTALGQNWPAGWMKGWGKPGSPPSHWFAMVTDRELELRRSVKLCSVPPFVQWKTPRFPSFRLNTRQVVVVELQGFFFVG